RSAHGGYGARRTGTGWSPMREPCGCRPPKVVTGRTTGKLRRDMLQARSEDEKRWEGNVLRFWGYDESRVLCTAYSAGPSNAIRRQAEGAPAQEGARNRGPRRTYREAAPHMAAGAG